jgi:hypothetical protein
VGLVLVEPLQAAWPQRRTEEEEEEEEESFVAIMTGTYVPQRKSSGIIF